MTENRLAINIRDRNRKDNEVDFYELDIFLLSRRYTQILPPLTIEVLFLL
jgi:hypothetical protein